MSDFEHLGPYELRGELGRGAMAKVWRAYDPKLDREVAIKEPLFDEKLSDDVLQEMAERFVREGKAAGRLNHPGIVTIYAADVYDNRPGIVMELIDGITLGDMLETGPIQPATAVQILDQLLDAAGYAHAQGVVHRDIKPDNIFITADGLVKLGDFGIAHVDDASMVNKTQIGAVLGTPGYMAPEQATGAEVDNRTDLFSIATIAYEMLTGYNPFGAGETLDSTTMLYRIVHEPPPDLPEFTSEGLPSDIRPAILCALNKNPDDRPQDAATFKAILHGVPAPDQGLAQTSLSGIATAYSKATSKKNRALPYIIVAAIGAIVVIALFVVATSNPNPTGGSGQVAASQVNQPSANVAQSANPDAAAQEAAAKEAATKAAAEKEAAEKAEADAAAAAKAAAEKEAAEKAAAEKAAADAAAAAAANSNTLYVCANDFVTLRESPSTTARAITRISVRETCTRLGQYGEWTQVNYGGSVGYVLSKFVSTNPNAPLVYDQR